MTWYGWIATALLIAVAAALIVPKKSAESWWSGVYVLIPLLMLAVAFYNEKAWVFH